LVQKKLSPPCPLDEHRPTEIILNLGQASKYGLILTDHGPAANGFAVHHCDNCAGVAGASCPFSAARLRSISR
jgi:hypothetical protein